MAGNRRDVRTVIGFRHSIAGQPPKQAASCSVRSAIVVFPEIASFILIVYENAARLLLRPQQLRQLGDVGGDAPGLVAREALVCVTVGLALEAGCRQTQSVCGGPPSNLSLAVNAAIRRSASARVRLGLYASSS